MEKRRYICMRCKRALAVRNYQSFPRVVKVGKFSEKFSKQNAITSIHLFVLKTSQYLSKLIWPFPQQPLCNYRFRIDYSDSIRQIYPNYRSTHVSYYLPRNQTVFQTSVVFDKSCPKLPWQLDGPFQQHMVVLQRWWLPLLLHPRTCPRKSSTRTCWNSTKFTINNRSEASSYESWSSSGVRGSWNSEKENFDEVRKLHLRIRYINIVRIIQFACWRNEVGLSIDLIF